MHWEIVSKNKWLVEDIVVFNLGGIMVAGSLFYKVPG